MYGARAQPASPSEPPLPLGDTHDTDKSHSNHKSCHEQTWVFLICKGGTSSYAIITNNSCKEIEYHNEYKCFWV